MSNLSKLEELLREGGSCLLAYSGGVDSTFLLAVAQRVLGGRCLAVTADSPFHEAGEIEDARRRAAELGARHEVIPVGSESQGRALENPPERCYHCKTAIFSLLKEKAGREGFDQVIEASHTDDLQERRPGLRALRELSVRSPLVEAGFTKGEIRRCSRELGLQGADRCSKPCLATRVPFGEAITPERLRRVGLAEDVLAGLGFSSPRVRDYGKTARIEFRGGDLERVADGQVRKGIVGSLRELGYVYVTVDLMGYRTGSMDEVLDLEEGEDGINR